MPQLNPEFFISQIFWLVLTFTFLLVFLWRISLPRISSVLEKRAEKINDDIKQAKQYQAEAEEIQIKIDNQLRESKIETSNLIKESNKNFQNYSNQELNKVDESINEKLDTAFLNIERNKSDSLELINEQIFEITKLTLLKISNIKVSDNEIKVGVDSLKKGAKV